MLLLPNKNETIVLPFKATEVESHIRLFVKPVKNMGTPAIDKKPGEFYFNGWVREGRFRISKVIKIPQNFLPLISGRIEATSLGCILFLHYRLFNSTILFLSLWTAICLFVAVVFGFVLDKLAYSILALLFAFLNYFVAVKNFGLQLKRSKADFERLIQSLNNNTNV
jgi:hypothetical protein